MSPLLGIHLHLSVSRFSFAVYDYDVTCGCVQTHCILIIHSCILGSNHVVRTCAYIITV